MQLLSKVVILICRIDENPVFDIGSCQERFTSLGLSLEKNIKIANSVISFFFV